MAADVFTTAFGDTREPARQATLVAVPEPEGELRFDIWLQDERETVFFDV